MHSLDVKKSANRQGVYYFLLIQDSCAYTSSRDTLPVSTANSRLDIVFYVPPRGQVFF
jgi:hypothetical protein